MCRIASFFFWLYAKMCVTCHVSYGDFFDNEGKRTWYFPASGPIRKLLIYIRRWWLVMISSATQSSRIGRTCITFMIFYDYSVRLEKSHFTNLIRQRKNFGQLKRILIDLHLWISLYDWTNFSFFQYQDREDVITYDCKRKVIERWYPNKILSIPSLRWCNRFTQSLTCKLIRINSQNKYRNIYREVSCFADCAPLSKRQHGSSTLKSYP